MISSFLWQRFGRSMGEFVDYGRVGGLRDILLNWLGIVAEPDLSLGRTIEPDYDFTNPCPPLALYYETSNRSDEVKEILEVLSVDHWEVPVLPVAVVHDVMLNFPAAGEYRALTERIHQQLEQKRYREGLQLMERYLLDLNYGLTVRLWTNQTKLFS